MRKTLGITIVTLTLGLNAVSVMGAEEQLIKACRQVSNVNLKNCQSLVEQSKLMGFEDVTNYAKFISDYIDVANGNLVLSLSKTEQQLATEFHSLPADQKVTLTVDDYIEYKNMKLLEEAFANRWQMTTQQVNLIIENYAAKFVDSNKPVQ